MNQQHNQILMDWIDFEIGYRTVIPDSTYDEIHLCLVSCIATLAQIDGCGYAKAGRDYAIAKSTDARGFTSFTWGKFAKELSDIAKSK